MELLRLLRRVRSAHVALVLVAASAACFPGARAPQVPPRGTLAPGGDDDGSDATRGAFAVVFGSPRGETVDPSEITLVFNRPMRALDLAGSEATPPVTMKPAAPGRWQWVGTSALEFVPEGHLAHATAFTIEVAAGTKALDGSALAKPYKLAFSTARPALVSTTPADGSEDLEPSSTLELRFNQPIAETEIARAVSLRAGDKDAPIAFDVRRKDPKNDLEAELVPKLKLPVATAITLHVDETLRGTEGPIGAGKSEELHLRTYGPLEITRLDCDRDTPKGGCAAGGALTIELTNRVKLADLKKVLSIEPKAKITWASWIDDDEPVQSVAIYPRLAPGKRYMLRIKGGASGPRDEHGQTLTRDWSKEVKTDDVWPSAEIGLAGSYLEPTARRDVPIGSVNVASYQLAVAPLDEKAIIKLEADPSRPGSPPTFEELGRMAGVKSIVVRPSAGVNAAAQHIVRTDDALGGKDRRGPLAIGIGFTERPGTQNAREATRSSIVQVTDLGITAKVSARGSFVWVTKLSSGAPVAGARVSIGQPGPTSTAVWKTDAEGLVEIPRASLALSVSDEERAVIFARTEDDFAYRRVSSHVNNYRVGAPFPESDDFPFGMIFSDRGIYRPGDVVKLKGIVRSEGHPGTVTPFGKPVHVKVETPEGEVVTEATPTLTSFGTFALDVKIPATAKLGTYSIAATVDRDPKDGTDLNGDFEVAEYRPAEFTTSVQSNKPSYVRGDAASWTAHGDFLFGAPMAGAEVHFSVTHEPTSFEPPDLPEGFGSDDEAYLEGLPDTSPRASELASSNVKLDAKGLASIETKLAIPGQRGPEEVTCDAEVMDLSRQTIAASSTAIVHPADVYAAIAMDGDRFVAVGAKVVARVLAVDPKGAHVAGRSIELELIHRTWAVAKQVTTGGAVHSVVAPLDRVVDKCAVQSGAAPARCELTPTTPGLHLLRATATDTAGRASSSSIAFYATGDGQAGWGDSDKMAVGLVPDRKSYEIGQTARVLVKSPFVSADALVTIERAGVFSHRRVKLSGATPTIDVPITSDLAPNAFVSVLLIRGRSKAPPASSKSPDVGAPSFRLGYASLAVNPESRRLGVKIATNKPNYRPGEAIDVDVAVRDRSGKPARAELTLYAVDEGVLSLVGYKTPDPIGVFGAPRALGVATIESREAIARISNPFGDLGLDKGLDGGDGATGSSVRRDFRPSAFYAAALVTDPNGHVKASFKLPESLTTYRIMAVGAAEDDRFGFGEARVTTSRPLMARPAFPRILRAGDVLDAGVIVTSKGLVASKIEVEIAADGLVLGKETKRTIDLPADGSIEVRFTIEARASGHAKVRFKVKGAGAEDSVEIERDVLPPMVPEAVALYGDTSVASAEKLGDLSAIRADVGGLEVHLSSTALVGLGDGIDQLIEYPYGCTEQLTSRLVPMLPLRDLARDYGIALPPGIDALVDKTVAKILQNQRGDGGFGLWADSPTANGWVSAYALWGLAEAKRRGVVVPPSAITGATRFVRASLEEMDHDAVSLATAAFVLDVLAANGAADPGRATRLFEEREKLPLFAQALLLHAMVIGKSDAASIERLVGEIEGHLRLDGPVARAVANDGNAYAVLMDSNARTSALVLRALVAAHPSHALASKLAMGLLADRRGGTWRSTQETAWALLGLDDYRKAQESTVPSFNARVFLGDGEIVTAAFKTRSAHQTTDSIPASRLVAAAGSSLAFSVEGTGRLFYEARLRYAKKEMPKSSLDRGFFVAKTLRPIAAAGLEQALATTPRASATVFDGGGLVLADLVIVTPSPRDFVVIDDPLPAGLEAIDARLATSGRSTDVDAAASRSDADEEPDDDARAGGRATEPSWFLREVRDDRVLFFVDHMAAGMYHYRYLARATTLGRFVLPPTRAEEMYAPEVFGRSGADVIQVRAAP